jgi:hypothetical protein
VTPKWCGFVPISGQCGVDPRGPSDFPCQRPLESRLSSFLNSLEQRRSEFACHSFQRDHSSGGPRSNSTTKNGMHARLATPRQRSPTPRPIAAGSGHVAANLDRAQHIGGEHRAAEIAATTASFSPKIGSSGLSPETKSKRGQGQRKSALVSARKERSFQSPVNPRLCYCPLSTRTFHATSVLAREPTARSSRSGLQARSLGMV